MGGEKRNHPRMPPESKAIVDRGDAPLCALSSGGVPVLLMEQQHCLQDELHWLSLLQMLSMSVYRQCFSQSLYDPVKGS